MDARRLWHRLRLGGSRNRRLLAALVILTVAMNAVLILSVGRSSFAPSTPSFSSSPFSSSAFPSASLARSAVREMLRHSWRQYVSACALPERGNELAPATNSCSPNADEIVGARHLLTVVDALDTLALLGLHEEFNEARELVRRHFQLKNGAVVSVFEVTIRLLGGFLGAFSLTGDRLFVDKAKEVGDALKGAFVELPATCKAKLGGAGFRKGAVILSEPGSLYLEFAYLAEVTGNPVYSSWAHRNQERLMQTPNVDGLYPNHISVANGRLQAADEHYTAGGEADSFYEYLVKRCLFDWQVDASCDATFARSLDGIVRHLAVTVAGRTCVGALGSEKCEMQHLACFLGGVFALAYTRDRRRLDWLQFAENVTASCYLSYLHSPTGLGPESFSFNAATGRVVAIDDKYLLRPETVESLYYLYHITGKQKYRDWGWRVLLALNRTARTSGGFSGVANVTTGQPVLDNTQWSFFLAETLKYLYLLFSPENALPMNEWVFNTEAHPLPSNRNRERQLLAFARWPSSKDSE